LLAGPFAYYHFDSKGVFTFVPPEDVTPKGHISGLVKTGQVPEGAKPVQWQGPWLTPP
jgi:hypothetical protein